MTAPVISVVIPVFNEEAQIERTISTVRDVLTSAGLRYELVLVDDGSRDGTWSKLQAAAAADACIRSIRLSRNFGKEAALCAGLDQVSGDACIVMDADLQHPPHLIPEMVRLWRQDGFPIVEAVKKSRGKESLINRIGAKLFYRLLKDMAELDLHEASDFKLLDSRIIELWRGLKERETFFRGLTAWVGFPRAKLFFEVPPRDAGQSRWSKLRLVKLALTALTSFSALPLQLVTTLGLLFLAGAIPMGVQTLYMKFSGRAFSGFTTVITLQLVIGSILMISLGIIGMYLARIFEEVKQRPRYIVSESAGGSGRAARDS
jgi:polyisoprenyl-phosphate glycosyltransferase